MKAVQSAVYDHQESRFLDLEAVARGLSFGASQGTGEVTEIEALASSLTLAACEEKGPVESQAGLSAWLKEQCCKENFLSSNAVFHLSGSDGHEPADKRFFEVSIWPLKKTVTSSRYFLFALKEVTDIFRAQAELAGEQKANYISLAEAQVGSWSFEVATEEIRWSESTFRIFGRNKADGVPSFGEFLAYLTDDAERSRLSHIVESSIASGKRYEVIHSIRRADGEIRQVKGIGTPEVNERNQTVRLWGTVIDVTEDLQRTNEIETLALVAQKTANAVVITDKNGLIEWVNDGFTLITEYRLSEVIGRKPGELLQGPGTDQATVSRIRDALLHCRPVQEEILNYSKSGRPYWLRINIEPVLSSSGELLKFVAVELDLSERKAIEERTMKLTSALEASLVSRDRLLAIISHDLRAPFNGLVGLSDILSEEADTLTSTEIRQMAGMINQTSRNTLEMLEKLLLWAKSQTGDVRVVPSLLNLGEKIRVASDILGHTAVQKGVRLLVQVDSELSIVADENMFLSLLQNLLSNAIKFSSHGGTVVIRAQQSSDEVVIEIEDNGVGMSEDVADRLFSGGFNETTPGTAGERGSGLGLILCKNFVERNGGNISVRSRINSGTTFRICFPLPEQSVDRDKSVALSAAAPKSSRKTANQVVIVVDDDQQFHFILSRMLSGLGGYHVVCFTEPSRALDALNQLMSGKRVEEVSLADLRWIFLDADMPGMSGPDLAKKLLNHPVFQRLEPAHIVGMSSRNDEHRAAEWRAAGVHIHADKRFTREDLRTLMSRVRGRGAA